MLLYNVTFDAEHPAGLAEFWSAVLERPVALSNEFVAIIERTESAPSFLFLKVPEVKTAKNRMHLDLDTDDLVAARVRLEALGASFVHEKEEFGIHWLTFRDPEGNEFCAGVHPPPGQG